MTMVCDMCEAQFTSLEHAKLHYSEEHNITDGYLKCSCGDIKYKTNNSIYDHIEYHLGNNPDRYKFVHYFMIYFSRLHKIPFGQYISL